MYKCIKSDWVRRNLLNQNQKKVEAAVGFVLIIRLSADKLLKPLVIHCSNTHWLVLLSH